MGLVTEFTGDATGQGAGATKSKPTQGITAASNTFLVDSYDSAEIALTENLEVSMSGIPGNGKLYSMAVASSGAYRLTFSSDYSLGSAEYNHLFTNGDTASIAFVGNQGKLEVISVARSS